MVVAVGAQERNEREEMVPWWLVGSAINAVGSVCVNLANNILSLAQRGHPDRKKFLWRVGASLLVLGSIGIFISYAYAPSSLLAPLGSVQFLSNVAFLKLVHNTAITRRVVVATAAILAGDTLVMMSSSRENPEITLVELEQWFSADT